MSFAQPLFLAGLIGALVPIIIHLIHQRRPRKQPFAAIELVLASVRRVEKSWRLKRWLLLASRVALLAALAIAAARPLWGSDLITSEARSGPRRVAIVVDASLSMRAKLDGSSAFSSALTRARNLIDALGPEDMAVVAVVDSPARLLIDRPSPDKGALLAKLRGLEPSYAPGDVGEAVSRAVEALGVPEGQADNAAEGPQFSAEVIVLSDMAESSFQGSANLEVPGTALKARLSVIDVLQGIEVERRQNRAITSVEALQVPGRAPRTVELRARIQSFALEEAAEPRPVDITLTGEDRELVVASAEVVAGTIVDKALQHSFETPGVKLLNVALEPDALAEDDRHFVRVEVRRQVQVLVVDGAPSGVPKEDEVFYLERALLAGASDQPPPRIIAADDLPRADLDSFDVVILAGVDVFSRQEAARLTRFVQRGGGLLITLSESVDAELYNSELTDVLPRLLRSLKRTEASDAPVTLNPPEDQDPITALFTGDALGGLASTQTRGYWLLQPATEPVMTTHLRYADGQPALVSRAVGSGRVALLTTSIDRDLTDLPIRPAFVPLMRQLVLHLGQALESRDTRRTLVGQRRTIRVPEGAQELRVTRPDGRETRWTALSSGVVTYEDARLPGAYSVSAAFAGPLEPVPGEHFVVNVDRRESNLRPLSPGEAAARLQGQPVDGPSPVVSINAGLGQRLDPDALAAALLVLMALAFVTESVLSSVR